MTLNRAMLSSSKDDWCTPPEVLLPISEVDRIGLDPCANERSMTGARVEYRLDKGQDGLELPWNDHGLVFVNPPYTRDVGQWLVKAYGADEAIVLIPARTDTRWWKVATGFDVICFWKGRIRFVGAESHAPFPSALLYRGENMYRFADVFHARGWVVFP